VRGAPWDAALSRIETYVPDTLRKLTRRRRQGGRICAKRSLSPSRRGRVSEDGFAQGRERQPSQYGGLHIAISYALIDELQVIAVSSAAVARVALASGQQRPGVTSTIIGARTVPQLDDNPTATRRAARRPEGRLVSPASAGRTPCR